MLAQNGKAIQQITRKMGFKETEIRHQTFYLNGKPIKVNAINTHMQHPELGHTMDEATIRKALAPYQPIVADLIPLSLEEIFIYELEVLGYDSKVFD